MDEYCAPLAASNTLIGGHGLKPSARGTRVRRSAAQRFILDGPFTESKELVGGYMIVQVRTLGEAIDTIRPWLRIHREGQGVSQATIEVRRLV
ncbi:MAG: transcriptional regulator [Kofleriaceae bacterium]